MGIRRSQWLTWGRRQGCIGTAAAVQRLVPAPHGGPGRAVRVERACRARVKSRRASLPL
ncbi:hypothetical protein EMIT0158MI4_50093 [Burkholderia ambifaria]